MIRRLLARRWCRKIGHDWLMRTHDSEFMPISDVCMRCGEARVIEPYGQCRCQHGWPYHHALERACQAPGCGCSGWQ